MASDLGPSMSSIDQARQDYLNSLRDSSIQGMPPGFIAGFRVILNPDMSVTVGPGLASVANIKVELDVSTNLTTGMEGFTRIAAGWAFIYLGRDGLFHVDLSYPGFYAKYAAQYHTRNPWRYIGRMWIDSSGITRFAQWGGFT